MKEGLKRIITATIGGILSTIILSYFGVLPELTSIPYSNSIAAGVIVFLIIYIAYSRFKKNRSLIRYSNTSPLTLAKSEPEYISDRASLERYGVVWRAVYGEHMPRRGGYTYLEGCYCPKCNTELDKRTLPYFIFWRRDFWVCPTCKSRYKIPKGYGKSIRDEVKKTFDAYFEGRLEIEEGEEDED